MIMFSRYYNKPLIVLCSLLLAFPALLPAKALTVVPSVMLDNILVDHKQTLASNSATNPAGNRDTVINANTLNLGLVTNWQTRKTELQTTVNTEFINRTHISGNATEDLDAFLQLNASANINLWQDKLFLSAELGRTQQASTQQTNIDNKLIGGSRWFNVNSGEVALDFNSRLTPNANFTSQLSANKTQADTRAIANIENSQNINTQSTSGLVQLDNANRQQPITWSLATTYRTTKRAQLSDFNTGQINLSANARLTSNLTLTSSAQQSSNQIRGNSSLSRQLEYKQLSAGVRWTTRKSSEFELNIYNSSSQRDGNEVYIGGRLVLNLSEFSQLQFNKQKNALGQADSLALSLQGKKFRLNLNYQKSIDINVRQGSSIASPASFICPLGSQNINDCIINTDANASTNGNFFQTFLSPQNFELNEQIFNTESLVFNLGYDNQRKIKLDLTLERAKFAGLESDGQNRDIFSLSGQLLYVLNSHSQLSLNASTNATERNKQLDDEQSQLELRYQQQLGQSTAWQAFVKQTDIDSKQRNYKIEEVQLGANITYRL